MAEQEEDFISKKTKPSLKEAGHVKRLLNETVKREKNSAITSGIVGAALIAGKCALMSSGETSGADDCVQTILTVATIGSLGYSALAYSMFSDFKKLVDKVDEKTKKMLDEVRVAYNQLKDEKGANAIVDKFYNEMSREYKSLYKLKMSIKNDMGSE